MLDAQQGYTIVKFRRGVSFRIAALGDVSWVEPGKYTGIWWAMHMNDKTWGSGPEHGATTANTKRHIDFAASYGFDGVLVEGWNVGWDGNWFADGGGTAIRFRPIPGAG